MNINEIEPINGIRVFTAIGGEHEFASMEPIIPKRHMVFLMELEDDGERISWQHLHFFDKEMKWYSLAMAEDKTVKSIIDTPLAQLLCCKTFFDHLGSRSEKITEVITIAQSDKKDFCTVGVDLDGRFNPSYYSVKTEIGNILNAIDLLIMDICFANYLEVAGELYHNSYVDYTMAKNAIEKIRNQQINFAESLSKVSFV